jgi:hypothetical protein
MSMSDAKLDANRANAQWSTGPKTEPGKARSSRNAVKHGLFCKNVLIPGEDPGEFHSLRDAFLRRLNPRDIVELEVVEDIIAAQWKLKRLRGAEKEAYLDEAAAMQDELARFHAVHNPTAKPIDPPVPDVGLLTWRMLRSGTNSHLDRLSRHEQRLVNNIRRSTAQLEQLQMREIGIEPTSLAQDALDQANAQNEATAEAPAGKPSSDGALYRALGRYQRNAELQETMEGADGISTLPLETLRDHVKSHIATANVRNEPTATPPTEPRTAA